MDRPNLRSNGASPRPYRDSKTDIIFCKSFTISMLLGISSRLPFDDQYRDLCELLTGQVATAIARARAAEERKHAEALLEIDRAQEAKASGRSGARILLVDDDPDLRHYVER